MIIGEIQKNSTEKLRVQVSEFKRVTFLDLRLYYEDAQGEWKPTKKGITVRKEDVDLLIQFLQKGKKKL